MVWRIVLVLLCLGAGTAYSEPPSPAPTKATDKQKTNATDLKQEAGTNQPVTEQPPAPVGTGSSVTGSPHSDKKDDAKRDYTSSEWWLVYITGALVAATLGLMCYTARLWRETQESIKLARAEFLSTHRPKIIVRAIYRDDAPNNEQQPAPQVTFSIANVGSTPATIFEISATVMSIDWDLCARPAYAPSAKHNTVIHIGNPLPITIPIQDDVAAQQDMASGFYQGNSAFDTSKESICCFGYILYRDSIERIYRTAFLRRYNPSTSHWDKVDDPDYEYQD